MSDEVKSVVGVLGELRGTPVLLTLVLLNGFFIVGAAYYLIHSEELRGKERATLIQSLDSCVKNTVPVDYLRRLENQ